MTQCLIINTIIVFSRKKTANPRRCVLQIRVANGLTICVFRARCHDELWQTVSIPAVISLTGNNSYCSHNSHNASTVCVLFLYPRTIWQPLPASGRRNILDHYMQHVLPVNESSGCGCHLSLCLI